MLGGLCLAGFVNAILRRLSVCGVCLAGSSIHLRKIEAWKV